MYFAQAPGPIPCALEAYLIFHISIYSPSFYLRRSILIHSCWGIYDKQYVSLSLSLSIYISLELSRHIYSRKYSYILFGASGLLSEASKAYQKENILYILLGVPSLLP